MPKGKANKNLENVSYAIRMAIEPLPWWEGILCNKIYAPSFFYFFILQCMNHTVDIYASFLL